MGMIHHGQNNGCPTGAATWIAKVLKVEEAQIILAIDLKGWHYSGTVSGCTCRLMG